MRRFAIVVSLLLLSVSSVPSAYAVRVVGTRAEQGAVRVSGDVAAAKTYSSADLAALTQVTLPDLRSGVRGSLTGVSLVELVRAALPALPSGKNPQLRVAVTVSGRSGTRSLAFGELDEGFGDHPALLALRYDGLRLRGGPYLAVPGDDGYARTVLAVDSVRVQVVPVAAPVLVPGSVVVSSGARTRTLGSAELAALPRVTATVTFTAAGMPQTHVESGPRLADVLRAARVPMGPSSVVTAVGSDGYAAAVTPAEATAGRRPLLLSSVEDGLALDRPRLIAVGDVKGGRDVSGVAALAVTG